MISPEGEILIKGDFLFMGYLNQPEKTAATINPGLAYVADSWQLAAEAIIPANTEGGRRVGVRAHLFLFLDDLIPAVFGKPLFDPFSQAASGVSRRR